METTKIYIEVPVSERLPEETGFYFARWDGGLRRVSYFDQKARSFIDPSSLYPTPDYWLEAVEVPTDELQKLKINQK